MELMKAAARREGRVGGHQGGEKEGDGRARLGHPQAPRHRVQALPHRPARAARVALGHQEGAARRDRNLAAAARDEEEVVVGPARQEALVKEEGDELDDGRLERRRLLWREERWRKEERIVRAAQSTALRVQYVFC